MEFFSWVFFLTEVVIFNSFEHPSFRVNRVNKILLSLDLSWNCYIYELFRKTDSIHTFHSDRSKTNVPNRNCLGYKRRVMHYKLYSNHYSVTCCGCPSGDLTKGHTNRKYLEM